MAMGPPTPFTTKSALVRTKRTWLFVASIVICVFGLSFAMRGVTAAVAPATTRVGAAVALRGGLEGEGRVRLRALCGARDERGAEGDHMLRIHETAIALLREVMPAIREIERSDPDLAGPMRRSVMSTPLNIAEGSARETWSALRAAEAAGCVPAPSQDLRSRFDRSSAHLISAFSRRPDETVLVSTRFAS